jgi:NifU-like protein involved in Fe-S cluster formation
VLLQVRVESGVAAELRFRAFGCPHFIAAASWLTDRLRGANQAAFEGWDWREVAAALEVPPAKFGRLLVLQDAVRALAGNWPGESGSTV